MTTKTMGSNIRAFMKLCQSKSSYPARQPPTSRKKTSQMDHPDSPPPAARPARRQRRLSEQPETDVYVQGHKPKADRAAIASKVISSRYLTNEISSSIQTPANLAGLLTTQLINTLRNNVGRAMPTLSLLDLYFCLWDCYVVKSAEKIHLDEEQQQLRKSNEWLDGENDLLVQRCNEHALGLRVRERVFHDLHAGVVSVLKVKARMTL